MLSYLAIVRTSPHHPIYSVFNVLLRKAQLTVDTKDTDNNNHNSSQHSLESGGAASGANAALKHHSSSSSLGNNSTGSSEQRHYRILFAALHGTLTLANSKEEDSDKLSARRTSRNLNFDRSAIGGAVSAGTGASGAGGSGGLGSVPSGSSAESGSQVLRAAERESNHSPFWTNEGSDDDEDAGGVATVNAAVNGVEESPVRMMDVSVTVSTDGDAEAPTRGGASRGRRVSKAAREDASDGSSAPKLEPYLSFHAHYLSGAAEGEERCSGPASQRVSDACRREGGGAEEGNA